METKEIERLKICNGLRGAAVDKHPMTRMTKYQNLRNPCTGFPFSSLEAIKKLGLHSHPLTPKSGRIDSSEAVD